MSKHCWYCGIEVLPYEPFSESQDKRRGRCGTTDHLTPLSQGGSKRDPANRVTACLTCNVKKHNRNVEEYRDYLYSLTPAGIARNALHRALSTQILGIEDQLKILTVMRDIAVRFPVPIFFGERHKND